MNSSLFRDRWHAVSERLVADGADALVVSSGSDLVYLTGYDARSHERVTAFVGRPGGGRLPRVIVPVVDELVVADQPDVYSITGWKDDQDPIAMVAAELAGGSRIVVSDDLFAHHLLGLMRVMPDAAFVSLSDSLGGLRSVKNDSEMLALQTAGGLANQIAGEIQNGLIPLVGRTEQEIATEVCDRLLAVGHESIEFCIVASGPNSASPHHRPGDRVVQQGEMVLFDFGGRHRGYCSDITRCVWTGPIPAEVAATYDTLKKAQQAAVDAARPGATLDQVDAAARNVIADAGFGAQFVHRTGHGIGTEVHEQPYVRPGNHDQVVVGHAFSIEPGIYFTGRWGMRLEDIVVIVEDGAIRCSTTDHDLVSVSV